MTDVAAENLEAQEAWNGVLFDRFLAYRDVVLPGLTVFGDEALRVEPPRTGDRVLDVGCGFGDTTQQLARLVGPDGSALGVDIAPRFVEQARLEAEEAGVANVRFEVRDVQLTTFEESFDYVFSRFGTMFFDNPVPALRNLRAAMPDDAVFCSVVWRQKIDNPWLHLAEEVVKPLLPDPDESETDEPRCGPGPFSMAGADTTSGQLKSAGFREITLRRHDAMLRFGSSLDRAVEMNLALGPAAEALRLAGERGAEMRPELEELLRGALAQFVRDDGYVEAQASTWIVTARA
ncbi:MAG TPA: class I SAM-dependent methyltransferase [Gaiellaceae bacterium]|nr:class I SAM-dependent methyltransferase [Gaiellaceae bacterium]